VWIKAEANVVLSKGCMVVGEVQGSARASGSCCERREMIQLVAVAVLIAIACLMERGWVFSAFIAFCYLLRVGGSFLRSHGCLIDE
jgi:hypothetical protein